MELAVAGIEDADEIMRVINAAYIAITGVGGFGFRVGERMTDPLEDSIRLGYQEGRIFKVVATDTLEIVGVTYWRITESNALFFGPFAVRPDMQGRGIANLMLQEIDRISKVKRVSGIEIMVVNWRTDLISWYGRLGYKHSGTADWPAESYATLLRHPTFFYCMVKPLGDEAQKGTEVTGGCLCGAVRYSISTPPKHVYYCHCSKCRKVSGSVVGAWLTIPAAHLSISGELSTYQSSETFYRKFCGNCGSHILFKSVDEDAEFVEICHGSLDIPMAQPPQNHIWVGSRLHYVDLNTELPAFDSEPSLR